MITLRQAGAFAVSLALAGLAAWQVIVTGMADRYAEEAPELALTMDAHNPSALLALAQHQLTEHHPEAAAVIARGLLRAEPLAGEAFAVLAEAAEAGGEAAKARALYGIAVLRAPQDLHARAWVIDTQLREGRYAEAMEQINILLRISPEQGAKLFPILVNLSNAPEFARALAQTLSTKPIWRASLLSVLLAQGGHGPMDQVYGALQHNGGLSTDEAGQWIERLMQEGLWGEAYSRWVGELALAPGTPLAPVYNGDFETEPSGSGFDWRISRSAGVAIDRVTATGVTGAYAIQVSFSGRRVPQINFEQRLLLAPGTYQLHFRARAQSLRSDKGLQWAIACEPESAPLGVSAPLQGSFAWKGFDTTFAIPAENCPAQRLWLHNPGAAAAGKEISGDILFDDFTISKRTVPGPEAR